MSSETERKLPVLLKELARDLGRPTPALYLALASFSIAKSVCLNLHHLGTRSRTHSSAVLVPAHSQLPVPSAVSDVADACCLPKAASVSAAVTGQQQAEACSQQLTSLLHDSPIHVGMQLLCHQHRRKHQQYLQHSYFDDSKRLLLFGCSVFALYAAQPSKKAWLSLMQQSAVPNELPTAEKLHDMLMPRTSAAQPMQPKWVPRGLSIQRM